MDKNKIHLVKSPFWVKISPCSSKCDKKYLMHAIGATFEGLLRAKEMGDFCRIKVWLDVQNPL